LVSLADDRGSTDIIYVTHVATLWVKHS